MNFKVWLHSTKNSLDLKDFNMNNRCFRIDLHMFMIKRIERRFSNVLSTLLHSMHSKTDGIGARSDLLLFLNDGLVQDLNSIQETTDFGLNMNNHPKQ